MENIPEWRKSKQRHLAIVLLGVTSYAIAISTMASARASVVEPHLETFHKPLVEPPSTFRSTSSAIAQLDPDGLPTVPDNLPTVPDNYLDPPPEVAPIEGLSTELEELQSRLANTQELPLFLPNDRGELISASTQLSTTQLSEPSFAWIEDQLNERYGPNERGQNEAAITQWRAYRTNDGLRYVDVIIDTGLWSQFTYFDRYAFVQQFGSEATVEGYQLRVFHTEDVDNYIEALTLEKNGRDPTTARRVFLRGSYFCRGLSSELAAPYLCDLTVSR